MNHLSVSMGIPKRQTPNHNERLPPSDRRGRNGTHAMKMPTQETKCNETHVQLFRTNQHTEKRGKPSMAVSTAAFRVGLAHNGGDLRVAAGGDVRSVCIELADTGVGIPPDVDIFQPFVTSKPGGMGLGLVITRHIVETHGGTITYGSQPGRGTTFCVTLPRTLET
jgi:light-regulated signal transduction histidine kinase (bacteriophytochrome)